MHYEICTRLYIYIFRSLLKVGVQYIKNNCCWPHSEIDFSLFLCSIETNGCNATRSTCSSALMLKTRVVRFSLQKHSKLQRLGQKLQDKDSSLFFFFDQGPLPLGRQKIIHIIKWRPGLLPSFLHIASDQKWMVRRPVNEATQLQHTNYIMMRLPIFCDLIPDPSFSLGMSMHKYNY